jgi:hypothetical protein
MLRIRKNKRNKNNNGEALKIIRFYLKKLNKLMYKSSKIKSNIGQLTIFLNNNHH